MIDFLVGFARLLQFAGAVTLFGAPFFFFYALDASARSNEPAMLWGRPLMGWSATALLLGAAGSLFGRTAAMAGDPNRAFLWETLAAVLGETGFGYAVAARFLMSALALVLAITLPARKPLWLAGVGLGVVILATFAWTGHGAAEEGAAGLVHAASNIIHLISAGVWLGALVALAMLLRPSTPRTGVHVARLHTALESFSGVGSLVVAALIASGLLNSWFLVGPDHALDLLKSPYGLLLCVKLLLFAAMLAVAGANRFQHTRGLGRAMMRRDDPKASIEALRRSVLIETGLGIGVILLVSILGVLALPSPQM